MKNFIFVENKRIRRNMDIQSVHFITFSPTQTSRQVGECIVRGIDARHVATHNITYSMTEPISLHQDALAVITVPVYGGRVAPAALERIASIHGDNTPAVAVVVYGNRAYEQALAELDAFISARGFKVIAGGTFIGEHSYSSEKYPIAAGRPNEEDRNYAELFGRKIRAKIDQAGDLEHLFAVDVRKIQRPVQPFFPLLRFLHQVIRLKKRQTAIPRTPQVKTDLCDHCGTCITLCPVQAITETDEYRTAAEKCIRCCACVKGCPKDARTYDTPWAPLLSDCFRREKEDRIIL